MKENLHQEIERLKSSNSKLEKKLKKTRVFFPLVVLLAIACWVGLFFLFKSYSKNAIELKKKEILDKVSTEWNAYSIADSIEMSFFDLNTTVDFFELNFLGNTNDRLINGGKVCFGDNEIVLDSNLLDIHFSQKYDIAEIEVGASYINANANGLYYRDAGNGHFYVKDHDGNIRDILNEESVGQTVVYGSSSFYVNFVDNHSIYYCDFITGEKWKIIDGPINKFAVVGKNLYILTFDSHLIGYDFCSECELFNLANVSSFTVCDGLFIQQGDNISKYNLSFTKRLKEYKLPDSEKTLISVSSDSIILDDKFGVYELNKNTKELKTIRTSQNTDSKNQYLELVRGTYDVKDWYVIWIGMINYQDIDYQESFVFEEKTFSEGSR